MLKPVIKEGDEIILPPPNDNTRAFFKDYRHDVSGDPVLHYTTITGELAEIKGVHICMVQVVEKPSIPLKFMIEEYAWFIDDGLQTDSFSKREPAIVRAKVKRIKVLTENGKFSVFYDFGPNFKTMSEHSVYETVEQLVSSASRQYTDGNT